MTQGGIGQSIRRKEDERLLNGNGLFVADVVVPNMLHAAFVRSPHAHAHVKAIRKPSGGEDRSLHRGRPERRTTNSVQS